MSRWRAGVLAASGVAYLPTTTSLRPVRQLLRPWLRASFVGQGRAGRVALTYDDGPDQNSTPRFLDLLERHDCHATFFLLGEQAERHPDLVSRMAAAGHELAVHGWDHTCVVAKRPGRLTNEIRRTRVLIEEIAGMPVRWYRPPFGVSTADSLLAARHSDLRTVLWSAWGRDWERRACGSSVARTVRGQLRTGGTVLLHDTNRHASPGSWRGTLAASDTLLTEWAAAGIQVGSLGEHFPNLTNSPAPALTAPRP